MQASDIPHAVSAAMRTAAALNLTVDHAIVLHDSNKLTLRLLPSDAVARVAHAAQQVAQLEVEVAKQLAATGFPVAALEPRVEPLVYEDDGYVVTFWTYYEPLPSRALSPFDYADALARLHAGMRNVQVASPHFRDRVEDAHRLVASRDFTPELTDADRKLFANTLQDATRAIAKRGATEQLLHGEPHPKNVITTKNGPLFIDLETCCRGPVEFDLAHVPDKVSKCYPHVDQGLLGECRLLVLAMVAAWRMDRNDQLPHGKELGRELLNALRAGPPYPALEAMMGIDER